MADDVKTPMRKAMLMLMLTVYMTTMWCAEAVTSATIVSAKKTRADETSQPLMLAVGSSPRPATTAMATTGDSPSLTTPSAVKNLDEELGKAETDGDSQGSAPAAQSSQATETEEPGAPGATASATPGKEVKVEDDAASSGVQLVATPAPEKHTSTLEEMKAEIASSGLKKEERKKPDNERKQEEERRKQKENDKDKFEKHYAKSWQKHSDEDYKGVKDKFTYKPLSVEEANQWSKTVGTPRVVKQLQQKANGKGKDKRGHKDRTGKGKGKQNPAPKKPVVDLEAGEADGEDEDEAKPRPPPQKVNFGRKTGDENEEVINTSQGQIKGTWHWVPSKAPWDEDKDRESWYKRSSRSNSHKASSSWEKEEWQKPSWKQSGWNQEGWKRFNTWNYYSWNDNSWKTSSWKKDSWYKDEDYEEERRKDKDSHQSRKRKAEDEEEPEEEEDVTPEPSAPKFHG
eukprot:TRINITY_DN23880_c0_g1_i1.p1 TRINITY_DN23880_c0_g1~~TRINITY_DN23880_c0_g1_i1.p1  ORF type:complete len:482 (+),score=119.86 TRINITY_DN23880_c0_g1_i1:77-1447(+)